MDKASKRQSEVEDSANTLWIPPLSPHDQKKLNLSRKKRLWQRSGFTNQSLWDWLQLLVQMIGAFAIPISIISLLIGVSQFNEQQYFNARQAIEQQQHDTQQALDQQQQTTLETYLDRMSELLFTNHLNATQPEDEVRSVARARTLTALQNLNGERKGILMQFLYESGLIRNPQPADKVQNPIIDLSGADLGDAMLSGVNFSNADLSNVDLSGADLGGAILSNANLNRANLYRANLSNAGLSEANLTFADLIAVVLAFCGEGFKIGVIFGWATVGTAFG